MYEDKSIEFTPGNEWQGGEYTLRIENRLEDLAGNNLNRVFDRDINLVKSDSSKEVFTRAFQIQYNKYHSIKPKLN